MIEDVDFILLLSGPAGAAGLYWALYRYYRNTDKSHAFERETLVESGPVTGSEHKVGETRGTTDRRIRGDNVHAYRERVRRIRLEPGDSTESGTLEQRPDT